MIVNGLVNKISKTESEQMIQLRTQELVKEIERVNFSLENRLE